LSHTAEGVPKSIL